MKIKKNLETLIGIIEKSLHEEGYLNQRFSESNKIATTSYDGLIIKDNDGKEYLIHLDESLQYNRENGRWEATHYIDTDRPMKFYEFSSCSFGYYALIGAFSEDEAIKFYEEQVGDIEDEDITPIQITKEDAKKRLLKVCNDHGQQEQLRREFNKYTLENKPYLILIDSSLL